MKLFTLILSLILVTGFAHASKEKSKEHKRGEFLKKELGLTDEQLSKVREIRKKGKGSIKEARKNFMSEKKAFHEALANPDASREELTKKFDSFQKARDEFQRNRFALMLEMRSILEPNQLQKFKELRKSRKEKWKNKRRSKDS
ncbi:MAG: Spy/CpxP family protein refolding chaperone [Bacteriovoracia bacterium]